MMSVGRELSLALALRSRVRRWAHRAATPVRWKYYSGEWGKNSVRRLPVRWRERLGLDDVAAVGTRRIEIGSGSMPQPGYLHVDCNAWAPHLEVVAAAWHLPFRDNWADEIIAIHTLEHVHPRKLLPTLNEWRRVLRRGCQIRVHVPNAPQLMEQFKRGTIGEKWALNGGLLGMYCTSKATSPEELMWPADHQILFDGKLLHWALSAAGYCDVVDRTLDLTDYHTEGWRPLVSHYSLVFEARKP